LLPQELKNFFLQAELKISAERCSVKKISFYKDKINIVFKNTELNTSFFSDNKLEDRVKLTTDVIRAISENVS